MWKVPVWCSVILLSNGVSLFIGPGYDVMFCFQSPRFERDTLAGLRMTVLRHRGELFS